MGEDRTMNVEKKSHQDVHPCRHRHSSVLSSCSEDAESESASAGYPLSPEEDDREEELEYGPGIVNKLRTRFLHISLKHSRGYNMRRSCSLENLLDQDANSWSRFRAPGEGVGNPSKAPWSNLKRAKSMDTLLTNLEPEPPCYVTKREPIVVRKRDETLNKSICDEELPKPDTVKTYKRMFEPAESKRGSHSRRPPVLRASAKAGVSKTNGVASSPSAKASNPEVTAKTSAKASSTYKAQVISSSKPLVNGNGPQQLCNGVAHDQKPPLSSSSSPVKKIPRSLCNGKDKDITDPNRIVPKKEVHFAQVMDVICNGGGAPHKDSPIKHPTQLEKPSNNRGISNNNSPKPKIPMNRPNMSKNSKPIPKLIEKKSTSTDTNSSLPFKLKPKPVESSPQSKIVSEIIKCERVEKTEKLSAFHCEIKDEAKILEENNRKNLEINSTESAKLIPETILEKKPIEEESQSVVLSEIEHAIKPKEDICKLNGEDLKYEPEIKTTNHVASPQKKSTNAPPLTSMVFDFRGKDVVPHVAVLPVPFGCKALHPKKRSLLIDGKEGGPVANGGPIDDEDDDYVDYSVPPPCGVVFEGENVKVGRGAMLLTRNKDLKISFRDDADENTFIYPSETSLLEEAEESGSSSSSSSSSTSNEKEIIPNGQPASSKLRSNTSIGSSISGGLSTYTPSVLRTMDNLQPDMFRPPPAPVLPEKEEDKNRKNIGEEENTQVPMETDDQEMLIPANPEIISSWSLSTGTADLLF